MHIIDIIVFLLFTGGVVAFGCSFFKKKGTSEEFTSAGRSLPVRLVKNDFFKQVEEAESRGATTDELRTLLGKGRAKKGIFEGDLFEGELEIGQVASCIHKLQTVDEVMKELVEDFNAALNRVNELKRFI
jgi:NAD(P)H-dependent flavin oxidoreductase YrpB (nitropropane dioxygenase family)